MESKTFAERTVKDKEAARKQVLRLQGLSYPGNVFYAQNDAMVSVEEQPFASHRCRNTIPLCQVLNKAIVLKVISHILHRKPKP